MLDLERLVRESGKPHRAIAAAANCMEATPVQDLESPCPDLQAGHPRSYRSRVGIRGEAGREGGLAAHYTKTDF